MARGKSAKSKVNRLTNEQVIALSSWIMVHGRNWRSALRLAWEDAGHGGRGYHKDLYTAPLQALRNAVGSSFLGKVKDADVQKRFAEITEGQGGPQETSEIQQKAANAKFRRKFPDVHVQLSGEDGNVFSIIGRVRKALAAGGATEDDLKNFWNEVSAATSYEQALGIVMSWVETS